MLVKVAIVLVDYIPHVIAAGATVFHGVRLLR